jgi:tetratricopeptide (TPR) repeat protein
MAERDDHPGRRDRRSGPGGGAGGARSGGAAGRSGPRGSGRDAGGARRGGPTDRTGAGARSGSRGGPGEPARRPERDRGQARPARRVEPALPDDVTGAELDRRVRSELASLAKLNAEAVARHLVMAGRLIDEDPEAAYRHAVAARDRAGRVAAVREAAGLTAYHTGRYAEALAELRAARRISGDQSLLPVMADCERGLGRPEKALAMAGSPEARGLDAAGRAEMSIVASGARRDLGQPEAAAVLLQGPELDPRRRRPWSARLFYAYAGALADAGRDSEAWDWLRHAAAADEAGETDAAERLAEQAGVSFVDEPEGEEPG